MPTFQFKQPNYVLSPPQHGTKAIVNDLTIDSSYKQVIDDLPITAATNLTSIDYTAVGVMSAVIGIGAIPAYITDEFLTFLETEVEGGRSVLDITGEGKVSSADALIWLKFNSNTINVTPDQLHHAEKAVTYFEENYEKFKDLYIQYNGATYYFYKSPPKNRAGTFDADRHYIVADASERIDRLKLVKYNSKPNFNHSYWFDAGTGSETEGLVSTEYRVSKKATTSRISGNRVDFDASDSTIVDTSTNSLKIDGHGFKTGDVVSYSKGIHLNFDASDSSIVDISQNEFNIVGHGFRDGDTVTYSVGANDIAIAPFRTGDSQLFINKTSNDSFKLEDEAGNEKSLTGLGLGIHSLSGASIQFSAPETGHKNKFYIIRVDDDEFKLASSASNAASSTSLSISSVGVGANHSFIPNFTGTFSPNDFIAISEECSFNSSSGVNASTNVITTSSAHGYSTGDTTIYDSGSDSPLVGLVSGALYHVIRVSDTTLKLSGSASGASAGYEIGIGLGSNTGATHTLKTEYGTKISRADDSFIYTTTTDEVVFTNRELKIPNWILDSASDIMLAKVFKFQTTATVKTTYGTAQTSHELKNISGERFRVGSTITSGISGNPKILSVSYTDNDDLGIDASITIDSAQVATANTAVVIETFAQEAYYNLESGDRLEDDEDPKLTSNLKMNNQSISDGTTSISSFVTATDDIANNDTDTTIPTSAAVKAYADSVAGGGTIDTSGTPVANDFARFTDSDTLEGRNASEVKTDLSLNNVENTAISTFTGSANITTVGTVGTGTWQGTAIADAYISSASTWDAKQDALTFGIADDNAVEIDDTDAASGNYARFTANGIEGRTTSDVLSDIGAQASLTFGIADDNAVEIDDTDAASGNYARFTANGIEGRTTSDVAGDISAVVTNADNLMGTNKKIQFRDSGQFINSSNNNQLTLGSASGILSKCQTFTVEHDNNFNTSTPVLRLSKNDDNPAADNPLGKFEWRTDNSANAQLDFAYIEGTSDVVTDGSEEGSINFAVRDGTGSISKIHTTDKDGLTLAANKNILFGSQDTVETKISSGSVGNLQYTAEVLHTFSGSDVVITTDDTGPNDAPTLTLKKENPNQPADGDLIGGIHFSGTTSGGAEQNYSFIEGRSEDVTANTLDGSLVFSTNVNNLKKEHLKITNGDVKITNARLAFQDDAADNARLDTPQIAFELVAGNHGNTDKLYSSVIAVDDRAYLSAYGFMLSGHQNGSYSTGSNTVFAKYNGGSHAVYANRMYSRTNSGFYLDLYTSGLGLRLLGSQQLYDNRYISFGNSYDVKIFYDNDAIDASTGELEIEMESACAQIRITDNQTTRFTFAKSTGNFTATGNVTAYSDERLKSDIKTLDPSKTLEMRGVEFTKEGKKGSGVIAQELEKIAPELVLDEGEYKSVAYGNLSGYLIETIKDQQKQIDELKALVEKLMEKV